MVLRLAHCVLGADLPKLIMRLRKVIFTSLSILLLLIIGAYVILKTEFLKYNGEAQYLSVVVADADFVGRVEVQSEEAVLPWGAKPTASVARVDGSVCGKYYHARVIESFKGPTQYLDFFSVDQSLGVTPRQEFLVFAKSRRPEAIRRRAMVFRDLLSPAESEDLECRTYGKYYVAANRQRVLRFDKLAKEDFGGDWVDLVTDKSLILCNENPTSSGRSTIDGRLLNVNGRRIVVINWNWLRRKLLEYSQWHFLEADDSCKVSNGTGQ